MTTAGDGARNNINWLHLGQVTTSRQVTTSNEFIPTNAPHTRIIFKHRFLTWLTFVGTWIILSRQQYTCIHPAWLCRWSRLLIHSNWFVLPTCNVKYRTINHRQAAYYDTSVSYCVNHCMYGELSFRIYKERNVQYDDATQTHFWNNKYNHSLLAIPKSLPLLFYPSSRGPTSQNPRARTSVASKPHTFPSGSEQCITLNVNVLK